MLTAEGISVIGERSSICEWGVAVTLSEGWYPDPNDQSRMRFWTGNTWEGERHWNGAAWVDTKATNETVAPTGNPTATTLMSAPPQPQTSAVPNLSSLQGQLGSLRMRMTATAWFLFAGAAVAAVSSFFAWETGTISDGLGDSYTESVGLSGAGRFVVIAIGVAIVALGWPVLSSMALSIKRRIGLTVVVGLLTLLAIIWTAHASAAGSTSGLSKPGPGFGTILCWIALVAVWVGVIRVWIKRRQPATARS